MIVTFVIVAYNAQESIENLFSCLRKQTYPHEKIEVILVDSNSSDKTKELMLDFENTSDFKRVVIKDNPKKVLPCGCNIALKAAQGDCYLRIDAHTSIDEDFIQKNIDNLKKGEDISSGKVVSVLKKDTSWGRALNQTENSMFGGGIADFRRAEKAKYVTTAAFAMYKKSILDEVGFYNETLFRTEDNEMHYRIKKAGYKFYYDPEIVSYRETRPTFMKLLKQKALNGYWVGRTVAVNPKCFSVYHYVPFCFVLGIILTSILAIFKLWQFAVVMWGAYAIFTVLSVIFSFASEGFNIYFLLMPFMFLLLHIGYGLGTLKGLLDNVFKKK